jgi:hypothetical protein
MSKRLPFMILCCWIASHMGYCSSSIQWIEQDTLKPSRINELIIMDFYAHEHWRNQYVLKKQQLDICQEQHEIDVKIIARMKREVDDASILHNQMSKENQDLHNKLRKRTIALGISCILFISTIALAL